jgi:hypothetical protein
MYAVVKTYSGRGAAEMFDVLEERKDEVVNLMRTISGFNAYTVIRDDLGGVTVAIFQDKKGADESQLISREWRKRHCPNLHMSPPMVSEGPVILNLSLDRQAALEELADQGKATMKDG